MLYIYMYVLCIQFFRSSFHKKEDKRSSPRERGGCGGHRDRGSPSQSDSCPWKLRLTNHHDLGGRSPLKGSRPGGSHSSTSAPCPGTRSNLRKSSSVRNDPIPSTPRSPATEKGEGEEA